MNLDEYLQGLENSTSEEDLLSKLVFNDNWDILFRTNFYRVLLDLRNSGNYELIDKMLEDTQDGRYRNYIFNYVPGTVLLQVQNKVFAPSPRLSIEDQEKQKRYDITVSLHPLQAATGLFETGKKFEGKTDNEVMAMVIRDLGKYAKVKKVPLCFVRPNIYYDPK